MPTQLPSVLAFERKLEVSDALMHAGDWEKRTTCSWEKIPITKRYNRSTMSSLGTKEENKSKPNPVASGNDDANLFQETDTLRVSYSLRVIGDLGKPFSCNEPDFEKQITEKVDTFKNTSGINALALRYAYNIANGRFLWRNRVGAEQIEIRIVVNEGEPLILSAYDFSLQDFEKGKELLEPVAAAIAEGLTAGANHSTVIDVEAFVKLGGGQHVFPSQKMNTGKTEKELFQLEDCAAMHSVKIGNALRTVDNWHGDPDGLPIAAEPFGSVTQRGRAYRPNKNDLYTLMVKWVNGTELALDEQCYVVANLVRGGLFQKGN